MKRTIKEVYDLIKEKRDNAYQSVIKYKNEDRLFYRECYGEENAYSDVLSLIESSHLLEEDKPIKGSGLEALEDIKEDLYLDEYRSQRFEIVEKDLQFVEALRKTFKFGIKEQKIGDTKLNMEVIAEKIANYCDKQIRDFILKECFPKELKALEIIKNKKIDCEYLIKLFNMCDTDKEVLTYYNRNRESDLVQEDLDLLKEVLL